MPERLDTKAGRIRRLQDLPPLPQVADSLLRELAADGAAIGQLADLIGTEPALTARVIGVANTAYFGGSRQVFSVQAAISRLGLNMVRGLALGLLINDHLSPRRCRSLDLDRYWFVSMVGARLARELSRYVESGTLAADQAYLSALLRQLGVIVLCDLEPQGMDKALAGNGQDDARVMAARAQRELGLDHHMAGRILAERWHLPAEAATAMRHYADPGYRGDHQLLVGLVGVCDTLAESLFDQVEACPTVEILDRLDLPASAVDKVVEVCREQRDAIVAASRQMSAP
ncbi:HDOD domain-containing protein [Ectothiorhodospira haloalkaliphila]|uniref:HDOD domain-containing protein n=1 Tax=Ectothiorhodospira haloalkaliphila TaxID=421628 RepID=UPI001EE89B7A|nr:HDOD domain-containing protein [Ectothiorhodospira haloalkaliphila]MCG5526433.1 HDOD domain-containing protein [Ectothiorhodospira haloalkaliphila]